MSSPSTVATKVLEDLRALGFEGRTKLAHDWAFHVDADAPAAVEGLIRSAEAEAWTDGHPVEVIASRAITREGREVFIEAFAYVTGPEPTVTFYGEEARVIADGFGVNHTVWDNLGEFTWDDVRELAR